jgi:sporulation protein YlmC with PRC-barrel domain
MNSSSDRTIRDPCISSRKVEGSKVYNLQGERLGAIGELIIDKHSGQVRYAVLEFGGLFSLGSDVCPLPWSQLRYDTGRDGYVVDLDRSRLEGAPRYPRLAQPDYTDDYNRQVHEYYGDPRR